MTELLRLAAILSILVALACAVIILVDEFGRPQPMRIMAVVWPVSALYAGPVALWAYFRIGRAATGRHGAGHGAAAGERAGPAPAAAVAKSALHCGAGCTLGDIAAEILLASFPGISFFLGWRTLWQDPIFSAWIVDFVFAFAFGILFQYCAIKPMHPELGRAEALGRALKADTLSLLSWQVGMYALMAVAHFWLFPVVLGRPLKPASPEFWWLMQFAMMVGFATAFPVNRWLVSAGVKEAM